MSDLRPRGRPLSFDRGAALDRVIPVFRKKGFASASLDELASAAGLNRPNLAAAFVDKRGLYLAALVRFRDGFLTDAGHALTDPGDLKLSLERFFDLVSSVYAEDGLGCFIFSTAPAASDDADIREELSEALRLVQGALEQRLGQSVGRELASEADTAGLASALSGVLLSLALHARAGSSSAELCELYRRAVPAILKGSLR